MSIKVTISGDKQLLANLALLRSTLDDGSIMDMALEVSLRNTRARFLGRLTPDGDPWPESKAGAARAKRRGPPYGTLYDTGNLFSSLSSEKIDSFNGVVFQDDAIAPYGIDLYDVWDFLGASDEDTAEFTGNALEMLLKGWK